MNSLFGVLYHIMEKTGMSWNEIFYKRSWVAITMLLADSPRTVKKSSVKVNVSGKQLFERLKNR
ncbi:hypothetical protein SAMN04515674_12154 [Pseudarcicella hirudinis]|uniref:Uncharacterized protein n=1 Tax=Pseudarcicella hirudinis TaxID=1079859 RepID=A0A1I5YT75_9BACT|nr:hypothetical protein SAMN04515674_113140 [Pseudarcicella hirudinis]SFQ47461.1 hypothetical protein SAMN04515674_12154 [Pseudarcicella hirudinis]